MRPGAGGGRAEVARRHRGGAQVAHAIQGFVEGGDDAGVFQHIKGTAGALNGFFAPQHVGPAWCHQHQVVMARAAAPTLPAWLVWIRMKRVRMEQVKKSRRASGADAIVAAGPVTASVCPGQQVAPCAPARRDRAKRSYNYGQVCTDRPLKALRQC